MSPSLPEDTAQAASDLATIRSARGGDAVAAERLAGRLLAVPRIVAAIDGRRGGILSAHDREDLTQDVLVIIWQKLDHFAGVGTLEAWLYRFCALEYQNRLRRRRTAQLPSEMPEPAAAREPMEDDALETSLTDLGPPEEDVVRLKHYEGLTFEEVGARLGVSPNTVKTRYYRGIRWLRQRLASGLEHSPTTAREAH